MAQTLYKLLRQRRPDASIDVLAPPATLPLVTRMAEIDRGLQSVLTPEQMQRYRALAREAANTRSATVWVQEADGMLAERRVRLGISDNQHTEVVAGDLAEGDLAVTRAREVRE